MLSNLLILIANIYSFIFHVYFRVRCAFSMFFPSVCESVSISSVFYRAVGTFLGYGNFSKKTWQFVIFFRPQEHYITNFRRLLNRASLLVYVSLSFELPSPVPFTNPFIRNNLSLSSILAVWTSELALVAKNC